jgi:hypothetical protein
MEAFLQWSISPKALENLKIIHIIGRKIIHFIIS